MRKAGIMPKKSAVIWVLVFTLITAGLLIGCDPTTTTPPATGAVTVSAAWAQDVAYILSDILPGRPPDNLAKVGGTKTGGEFDVNAVFSVLNHLSMEEGYVMDYVYDFFQSGGSPLLYVRPASAAPYKTYDDFASAADKFTRPENDKSLVWMVMGEQTGVFGNKIKIDSTKEGYFEYTALQILGAQFYLWWHANYNDTRIVCQPQEVESVLTGIVNSGLKQVDDGFKRDARRLNLEPSIEISGDLVTVKLVAFSKWGGFSQLSYMMYKNYPHSVIGFEDKTLLEYNCGMMF